MSDETQGKATERDFFNFPQARKAPTENLIRVVNKISTILSDRTMNSPSFDEDQILQELIGREEFDNPDLINNVFIVNNSLIGIASVMPKKEAGKKTRGNKTVVPIVQVMGQSPYTSWDEASLTFLSKKNFTLRTPRSVTLHRVVPNMRVFFRHYSVNNDGISYIDRIDCCELEYDDSGHLISTPLPEAAGIIDMPQAINLDLE